MSALSSSPARTTWAAWALNRSKKRPSLGSNRPNMASSGGVVRSWGECIPTAHGPRRPFCYNPAHSQSPWTDPDETRRPYRRFPRDLLGGRALALRGHAAFRRRRLIPRAERPPGCEAGRFGQFTVPVPPAPQYARWRHRALSNTEHGDLAEQPPSRPLAHRL